MLLSVVAMFMIVYQNKKMYNEFAKKFGEKIKKEREKMGLTQEELALEAGVSRAYIGMLERAERSLTLKKIYQVSRGLDIKFPLLFDFDE